MEAPAGTYEVLEGHYPGDFMQLTDNEIELANSILLEPAAPMALCGAAPNVDETTTAGGPGIQNQVVNHAGAYVANAGKGYGQLGRRTKWDRIVEAYVAEAELKYVDFSEINQPVREWYSNDMVMIRATEILKGDGVHQRVGQRVTLQAIDINWTLYNVSGEDGKKETVCRLVMFQWNTSTTDALLSVPRISSVIRNGLMLGQYERQNEGKYTILMDETVCLTDYGRPGAFGSRRITNFRGSKRSDHRTVCYTQPDSGADEGLHGSNMVYFCVLCDPLQDEDRVQITCDIRTWFTDD